MQLQRWVGEGNPGRLRALVGESGEQVQARSQGVFDRRRDPLRRVELRTLDPAGGGARHPELGWRRGPRSVPRPSWEAYGVDANGDGVKDPYSIPDSIFATANLLHADGAPGDWHAAIFDYNHAEWYVEEVLEKAASLGARVHEVCAGAAARLGELPTEALARVEYVAKWIESRRIHYCWGGGHAVKPGPSSGSYCWSASGQQVSGAPEKGLDCSGAVRWLLVLSGYKDPGGLSSALLGAAFPSGPGQAVTIWSNIDHVWIEINGQDWGTATSNFAHGPGFGPQSTAGFLASHPPGL